MVKNMNDVSYSLLLFGLAAVAWSLSHLLKLNNFMSIWLTVLIAFLAAVVSVVGVVHYWRYAPDKRFK